MRRGEGRTCSGVSWARQSSSDLLMGKDMLLELKDEVLSALPIFVITSRRKSGAMVRNAMVSFDGPTSSGACMAGGW